MPFLSTCDHDLTARACAQLIPNTNPNYPNTPQHTFRIRHQLGAALGVSSRSFRRAGPGQPENAAETPNFRLFGMLTCLCCRHTCPVLLPCPSSVAKEHQYHLIALGPLPGRMDLASHHLLRWWSDRCRLHSTPLRSSCRHEARGKCSSHRCVCQNILVRAEDASVLC